MDKKALGEKSLSVLSKMYAKFELVFLKAFRGLLMEEKGGGWELSKGNVAFWVVLTHCMYVWSGKAKTEAVGKALETAASAAGTAVTEGANTAVAAVGTASEAGLLDSVVGLVGSVGVGTGVPEQEFWLLMALLGYSTVKTTKGGLSNALGALRGGK